MKDRLRHHLRTHLLRLAGVSVATLLLGAPHLFGQAERVCIIVSGLGGMPEYEENFLEWAERIEENFQNQAGTTVFKLDGRTQKKPAILEVFDQVTRSLPLEEVWIFLIGHASYDNQRYRFNISGPDITDKEIKTFLDTLGENRTYLVVATSASGKLAAQLGGEGRVIVTATKSESEKQPPLFMSFFSEALSSEESDLDKDGKVSLLEAYFFSNQQVALWYEGKKRIQTEHSLLDDHGEIRLTKGQDSEEDEPSNRGSLLASTAFLSIFREEFYRSQEAEELASQRVTIQREIEDLKFRKSRMSEEEYYRQLESLLVNLASLSRQIEDMEEEVEKP